MASMRILLVDDSSGAKEALGTLPERDGHEVKRVQNGPERTRRTPDRGVIHPGRCPDRYQHADVDGVALAQLLRLRARCSQTEFVALTGYANSASRLQSDERVFEPSRQTVVAR